MSDDDFRDPVGILNGAMAALIAGHGEDRAQISDAWRILNEKKQQLELGCIQSILGDTAKDMGQICRCPRHPPEPEAKTEQRNLPMSGKSAASGERDDE